MKQNVPNKLQPENQLKFTAHSVLAERLRVFIAVIIPCKALNEQNGQTQVSVDQI